MHVFYLGDAPDAWQAWYDDKDWTSVTLPHDWSVRLPFSKEYSSGTGYLAGGIGWYRIHVAPNEAWRGKQIRVQFESVYKNSRVWCNSAYLGERPNGYSSFGYDVSDCFHFDRDNIISVYVDRRELSDSRWFTGSGITGGVTLSISEKIYPVENGIFFHTPRVTEESADFEIVNELANATDRNCLVTVTNVIFDTTGKLVGEAVSQTTVMAHSTTQVQNTGTIAAPDLWSPQYPYLYTVKTYLSYQKAYQVHEMKVGIRTYRFHSDKGFILNGAPAILKGVCLHHDAGCLGAAVPYEVWTRRLIKLKKMGCNAIRMSHNPHMPALYTLCDILGFFVIDEAFDEWEGPKNKWWQGHNVYPPRHEGYYTDFPVWHERDLTDMIRRDRNHPSVILWSIGNEIDYPNDPYCHSSFDKMTGNNDANKPESERLYNALRPNAERLAAVAKHLCDLVRSVDTTHPVTLAAAFPELSANLGFLDAIDVAGYNYKENLYAAHHMQYPDKPFFGSKNDTSVSHSLYTTMAACQMFVQEYRLAPEITELIGNAVGSRNPFHQFEVTLRDGNGRRVCQDATLLTVTVENGTLLGLENGDLADTTEYTANYRRAYRGQLIIYAADNEATSADTPLTVTVRGDFIRTERITV